MESLKTTSVASAKITFPRSNRPLLRPRLFQRLDDLRDTPVIWVVGAPGAGKTTLVSSYLVERGLARCWLQLDVGDADVATFFYYLSLALHLDLMDNGPAMPPLLPANLSDLMSFTRRYAEALAARMPAPAVIVFDNYEQIPVDAPLHGVIRQLATSLPPDLNLLILSRTEPPPAFARLRIHEDLVLIGGRELDLTQREAGALAAARGGRAAGVVDVQRVERLLSETQGWFAGFAFLLAERCVGNAETITLGEKNHELLFDYFATELFGQFDPLVQEALLRIAPLPSLTAVEAEQLTGSNTIGALLKELHRKNYFVVQRGQEQRIYEFHALFRAFLLNRAASYFPEDEWRALQSQAADVLTIAGRLDPAAALYRSARNWPGLSSLVLRAAAPLIASGRHQTLEQWLDALPADIVSDSPWLAYWRAQARLPFDPVAARAIFERAYSGFDVQDDAEGLYSSWSGLMESFFFEWRDFRPSARWIAEFGCLRKRHPHFPSRAVELNAYWAMGTLLHAQPQHPLLPVWAERAQALLDQADRDLSVLLAGYLIIWFLWQGESSEARGLIDRIAPWTRQHMSPVVRILWSCAVGLYHSVRGAVDECLAAVEEGLALGRQTGLQTFDFLLAAQMARCHLVAGNPAQAEAWMASMAGTMRSHSHIDAAFYLHLRSNAAAQCGNWQLARHHAHTALSKALESGVPFLEAHCHLDLARALFEGGEDSACLEHIDAARAIGELMGSRVLECLALEAAASLAIRRREDQAGSACLGRALALGRAMGGVTYRLAGPQACVRLYCRALATGLEVEYVQDQIHRHRLVPPDSAAAPDAWPWPVRIYTLGRFEILCDGEILRSSGKAQHKPLELLKCLCAFGGKGIAQDRVTDALWPDAGGDAADQALRTTLHRLRKLLRCEQSVRLEDRHLTLDSSHVWADCLQFDRASNLPRLDDVDLLRHVLDRYRGPFLHGESGHWALVFRERLRAQFMRLVEQLGTLLERNDDWPGAADCYAKAIGTEPLAESLYRRLMAAYVHLGRRSEALATYQRCRQALLSGLGVSPARETQLLCQQLENCGPMR